MAEAVRSSRLVRFGTFEVDLPAGELRKSGVKLKLTGQPFQVLTILLERPGEVVTREELQKRLWPDTFVDVDHNLNTAINKIREVLGDSAESPRFVETLPRRGYRFVAATGRFDATHSEARPVRTHRAGVQFAGLVVLSIFVAAILLVGINVHGWRDHLLNLDAKPAIQSLAVLPLANLSKDPEQEYLADGMTEALITELGKLGHPRVISRQSIMQYRGSKKSLQDIAKELNVDALLEGEVERSDDRIRLSVHLSQVDPESQVWAREYKGDMQDVLGLRNEIARAVADEIHVKLTPQERAGFTKSPAADPRAQDDYLHGRYFLNRQTERDLETAINYYKSAIAKDSGYALPHAGLAEAYTALANPWTPGHSPRETLGLAKSEALRALQLDPSLTEAHVELGWCLLQDWNWQEAEKEARLAISLNPSSASAHFLYSTSLSVTGRHDEAISELNDAIQADPLNPDYKHEMGWTLYRARRYNLAIAQFESLDDNPGLGSVYLAEKIYPEAIAVFEKDIGQSGRRSVSISLLAGAYGGAGKRNKARKLLDELTGISRNGYVSPFLLACSSLAVGERDQALTWIERGYQDRDQWTIFLKTAAVMDPLRSEPRFQAVLQRMNFPQ